MSSVEILVPAKVLLKIYETKNVGTGMTYAVPGGATLTVGGVAKRHHDSLPLVPIIVTLGPDVALNSLSSWLYDKLKGANVRRIRIEGIETELTMERITKTISESIDSERSHG